MLGLMSEKEKGWVVVVLCEVVLSPRVSLAGNKTFSSSSRSI